MFIDLLHGNLPASDVVAVIARRAELSFMDVGVAVGAPVAYVGEDWLRVAISAAHRLVHPAKGKACAIVVEFRETADRSPGAERMTVLTWDIEWAVRVLRDGSMALRRRRCGQDQNEKQRSSQG